MARARAGRAKWLELGAQLGPTNSRRLNATKLDPTQTSQTPHLARTNRSPQRRLRWRRPAPILAAKSNDRGAGQRLRAGANDRGRKTGARKLGMTAVNYFARPPNLAAGCRRRCPAPMAKGGNNLARAPANGRDCCQARQSPATSSCRMGRWPGVGPVRRLARPAPTGRPRREQSAIIIISFRRPTCFARYPRSLVGWLASRPVS